MIKGVHSTLAPSSHHNQQLSLRIADISYEVISHDPSLKLHADGAIQRFLVEGGSPDVSIEAVWDDPSALGAEGRRVFDSGAVWQLYEQDRSHLLLFSSPVSGSMPYKAALMSSDYTRGKILLNPSCFDRDQPVYPLEYPLDELILINLLAMGRGVEMHACGLVDSSGRGYLFAGQSGGGKTTMAKLWRDERGVTVLSDDRIVLRKMNGRIWMYGTPWHGEALLASPAKVPLTRLFFLRHGKGNEFLWQVKADAVSRLLACSFVPFHSPGGIDFTLGFLAEVAERVPCDELTFLPDKRVVAFIRGAED